MPERRGTLVRTLALWLTAAAAASFVVFAAVAYVVTILQEESEPGEDSPEQIAAEAQAEVRGAMTIAAPIGLALAAGGAVFLSRRALRPLGSVVQSAAAMTAHELDRRLPVPEAHDEVRAVVLALNGLFDRLETGFGALGRFAGEASHELRTPLAVVAAELEVMLRSPRTSAEWEASARTCLDEIRHLSRLVEALLEMSRAEGTPRRATGPVDVGAVIDRALAAFEPRAAERGVRLAAPDRKEGDGVRAAGDADALESAVRNVLDNAIRHTPSGGEVRVSWTHAPDGAVHLDVDDSGPGVDSALAARIFEPFVRGDAASGRAGLGLTIARRILEAHGAHVEVGASHLGGARLRISLPVFSNS